MKRQWLNYLRDPFDESKIKTVEIKKFKNGEITSGKLISKTGNEYKIREGVPVLLSGDSQSQESVKSFAYEWEQFGFIFAKRGWLKGLINPLVGGLDFFKDKVVIDAGSGSGAQSRWIAEAGAKLVISLELSDSIFTVHPKSVGKYKKKVFAIQCDIAHPPLNIKPDVVYCMNVIQHTKDPEHTFLALSRLVQDKTLFLFNIYDKSKHSDKKLFLIKWVRVFIKILPFVLWKWLAFVCVTLLFLLFKVPKLGVSMRRYYPVKDSFKEAWLNLYDLGGGHFYQEFFSKSSQESMIKKAGLKIKKRTKFGYVLTR